MLGAGGGKEEKVKYKNRNRKQEGTDDSMRTGEGVFSGIKNQNAVLIEKKMQIARNS